MSTGYASDTSTGSNKRARTSDDLPTASGGVPQVTPKSSTPIDVATANMKSFVATLHQGMRTSISGFAEDYLVQRASHFRQEAKLQKEKNDPEFIPHEVKVKLPLHPVDEIVKDPGFIDLAERAAGKVKQARLILKEPIMECRAMNVNQLKINAQKTFVEALPYITKFLIAEENIQDYNEHTAVVDLLSRHNDVVMSFLGLGRVAFVSMYKEVHSLSTFPQPSRVTPINPQGSSRNVPPLHMRGGTLNSGNNNNSSGSNTTRTTPTNTAAANTSLALAASARPQQQQRQQQQQQQQGQERSATVGAASAPQAAAPAAASAAGSTAPSTTPQAIMLTTTPSPAPGAHITQSAVATLVNNTSNTTEQRDARVREVMAALMTDQQRVEFTRMSGPHQDLVRDIVQLGLVQQDFSLSPPRTTAGRGRGGGALTSHTAPGTALGSATNSAINQINNPRDVPLPPPGQDEDGDATMDEAEGGNSRTDQGKVAVS